jgi:hypothetical protein
MKFIEITTQVYDNDIEEDVERAILINITDISSVEMKNHRRVPRRPARPVDPTRVAPPLPQVEATLTPTLVMSSGHNYYCYDHSYDDLKRILLTGANIRQTGVTRT